MNKNTASFRCLKGIGFCTAILWTLFIAFFITGFALMIIFGNQIRFALAIPIYLYFDILILFACALAFLLLIFIKEKFYKETNISIGLFEKTKRFLNKKWITNVSIFAFYLTCVFFIMIIWTWLFFIAFFIICCVYNFIKSKI